MKKTIALTLASVLGLSACVSPEVVTRTNAGDRNLSCAEIEHQLHQLDEIRAEAKKGRSVSGTNVAAAILFWPAVIGNHANATQALEAANERNEVLVKLASEKRCKI